MHYIFLIELWYDSVFVTYICALLCLAKLEGANNANVNVLRDS